jgi:tetratricopeptide (TPR) repeat protein
MSQENGANPETGPNQKPASRSNSRLILIVLALVAAGGGMFAVRHLMNNEEVPEHGPEIDFARVTELRNLGLAWVENLEYDKAASAFQELTELVPDERLPWQNLAITKLLKAEPETTKPGSPEFPGVLDEARAAIDTFAERYPDDVVTHLLRARYFLRLLPSNEFESAADSMIDAYQKAISKRPDYAFLQYQLFDAVRLSRDKSRKPEAFAALSKAWELDADNLHLMREMFREQTHPDQQDPKVVETFETARTLVAPYTDKIQKFARTDLMALIDQGVAAMKEENWGQARGCGGRIGNVLAPEVASQNDKKEVEPHLLEFLVFDFAPDLTTRLEKFRSGFPEAIPVQFSLATDELGIRGSPSAVATGDFDLDGKPDIVAVRENEIELWQVGKGRWSESASVKLDGGLSGVCVVGLDRDAVKQEHCWDADPDLIVFGKGGVFVVENSLDAESGKRSLVLRDRDEKLAALRNVLAVLPVDYDHDGDLDLIVSAEDGVSMWLNIADWTFIEHSQYSKLPPADAKIHSLIAVDWDRDVAIDVLCLGENTAGYLGNILHGRLRWQEFPEEAAWLGGSKSLAVLESDANFSWDILAADDSGVSVATTMNPDAGVVKFRGRVPASKEAATGATTWDFDNDGFLDVIAWNGANLRTIRGGPQTQFQAIEGALTLPSEIHNCVPVDLDQDGDLDLLALCESSLELILNEGGNANGSMSLPIRAESDPKPQSANQRVNMHCLGSLIEVATGPNYQAFPVTGQWTHIGLGKQSRPDSIRVIWTNGIPEHIIQPDPEKVICLQQRLKGSCPYIYTWDGEQFAFFTDCLWAAPIGLQVADGVLAPCREWEYLKIDGDRLVEKDGEYHLLMTEELWEVGYVDSMRLLEVIHPKDVEVYSNEKVGPPSISEFKVHTVRSPRKPLSAVNHRGRDLMPELRERDDVYAKPFDRKFKQGLTEPHYIEFDLGDLSGAKDVTLFLTGWIRPTDTSLNIAISQRPDLESTKPPSIHVPDKNGEWQKVRPFIGFPGGKTKTISVELSGVFLTDDFRVRLATSMEIYWDDAFFTVDEEPVELQINELPLKTASMSYRGFSKRTPHLNYGPERYDAAEISTEPHWPPVLGKFTRYGDVQELLGKTDDRMVALGAGDSIEVRFAASKKKLPAGCQRDFVLHNVGWDKDADLNTVFGQTVDPLPFAGMTGYPDLSGEDKAEPFADQSRTQSRTQFWRLMFDENRYRVRQGARSSAQSREGAKDRKEHN